MVTLGQAAYSLRSTRSSPKHSNRRPTLRQQRLPHAERPLMQGSTSSICALKEPTQKLQTREKHLTMQSPKLRRMQTGHLLKRKRMLIQRRSGYNIRHNCSSSGSNTSRGHRRKSRKPKNAKKHHFLRRSVVIVTIPTTSSADSML